LQQPGKFRCGRFTVFGPIKGQIGKVGYKCLFCNSYRCSGCRPGKLKRVRARLSALAEEHKLRRFATLTLDPSRIPKSERSDHYIRECWRKMRVVLARRFGATLPFIAALEFHRSGVAHLHVLFGVYIPQAWLSDAWQSIGGGRIVDIRHVDVHRVAGYLAAYLSGEKVEHTLSLLPARARIFTTSRSIVLWGNKQETGWKLCRKSLWRLRNRATTVFKERFEPNETLRPYDLELLTYFEGPPIQEALEGRDVIEFIKNLISAGREI
jgi:hypothetical protein